MFLGEVWYIRCKKSCQHWLRSGCRGGRVSAPKVMH